MYEYCKQNVAFKTTRCHGPYYATRTATSASAISL